MQLSTIGKLPQPAAALAATRKKAGLSVAIGSAGWEFVVPLTCQTTGALAGWFDSESAGTRTRPADARTGCDATNAGAGCWCGDIDIACCCGCSGGEIGTAKLYTPTPPLLPGAGWLQTFLSSGTWHKYHWFNYYTKTVHKNQCIPPYAAPEPTNGTTTLVLGHSRSYQVGYVINPVSKHIRATSVWVIKPAINLTYK